MNATIRLGDLGLFVLGTALLVLIVYAILFLKNLNDTMGVVKRLVEDNRNNIDSVLEQAPSIASNIESISSDLSHDVKAVQDTFDQIIGTTEVAVSSLTQNTDVLTSIVTVVQVITFIKELLGSFGRKRKWL